MAKKPSALSRFIWSAKGLALWFILAIVLWYITIPIDLVPDGIAIFGYVDDAVAIFIALYLALNLATPEIYKQLKKILMPKK